MTAEKRNALAWPSAGTERSEEEVSCLAPENGKARQHNPSGSLARARCEEGGGKREGVRTREDQRKKVATRRLAKGEHQRTGVKPNVKTRWSRSKQGRSSAGPMGSR